MTTDTTFSVRPATADDLRQIVQIEGQFYPNPWTQAQFEEELDKPFGSFWVLTDDETDETVAAYLIFWAMEEVIELLNITVDLPYRGMGYGTKLLQRLVQYGLQHGKSSVFLEVRKSNSTAIQLYQKAGFDVVQVRKRFYADGEDAYHMRLDLLKNEEVPDSEIEKEGLE